jgi:hypothetical protein
VPTAIPVEIFAAAVNFQKPVAFLTVHILTLTSLRLLSILAFILNPVSIFAFEEVFV